MSIRIIEKQVLYDNLCAPIVKFSHSNNIDEEDMIDDQTSSSILHSTLEHSFKTFSLENLVKSFDNTINSCFSDQQMIESIDTPQTDLISTSNTWSELIENLRTSLRNDLKLPHISNNYCIYEKKFSEDEFQSIDNLNEEEENHEPFLTAEQVINEIDFILKDMTPDSGYYDNEFDLKNQSINSLNKLYNQLNISIKDLSNILVHELAIRDKFDYEKEIKNTFISLVFNIQNKRRSILKNRHYIQPGTYLTTIIPFDREHSRYLSVEYLQSLNKILHTINEDSSQVPELLTNYILKILCPC